MVRLGRTLAHANLKHHAVDERETASAFKNARVTRFSRTVVSLDYGETFRLERSEGFPPWSPCCQQKTRRLLATYSFFFDLPDKRHQSIPHFPGILRISRQILVQEFFLIQKPPYERRHNEDERTESPPRAERKRGPMSKGSTPAYIGWRTTAYEPGEMTVCPSATW